MAPDDGAEEKEPEVGECEAGEVEPPAGAAGFMERSPADGCFPQMFLNLSSSWFDIFKRGGAAAAAAQREGKEVEAGGREERRMRFHKEKKKKRKKKKEEEKKERKK